MTARLLTLLSLALLLLAPPRLAAQDRFGQAVAVAGTDVLVLKPAYGQGFPAVHVFRGGEDGTWSRADRLGPAGAEDTGEGFSTSLAVAGDLAVAAGGDGAGRLGGHVYERASGGGWAPAAGVSLRSAAGPPAGGVDLATVMAILQPDRRVVALSGDGSLLAVGAMEGRSGAVHLFERTGSGDARWIPAGTVGPADGAEGDGFGAAVAVGRDVLFVGAPGRDGGGAVVVFTRDVGGGPWTRKATIRPGDLPASAGFGAALTLAEGMLAVGAPGADAVLVHAPDPDGGSWREVASLRAGPGEGRRAFGAAIAADGSELWIGAPLSSGARGAVHRFEGSGNRGWKLREVLAPAELEPRSYFGAALDVEGDLAVVGAHGARGTEGRAVVYARRDGSAGWSVEAWLEPGTALAAVTGGEVLCRRADAAGFACRDVDLLAYLPLAALGAEPGERVSDLWGWTDPRTEREYALVGRTAGMLVVDVTDPTSPGLVALVPANPSGARDIKVYEDHAFFTGDGAGDHGLVVFDLRRIRELAPVAGGARPPALEPDTVYREIASAHNLALDTGSGFAFAVGASGGGTTCGGGLHMVDVRDPLRPAFAGCYTDTHGLLWQGRTHDAQCVVYDGPDADHQGREICFASNETALRIVDVTDKESPVPVSAADYPGRAYIHQGWLTDDRRHFYVNDELDELVGLAEGTRTLVWDVADLDDPVVVGEHVSTEPATDHNLYIVGDRMYQANYHAGLRVLDIGDRAAPVEIGFFDTTPYGANPPGFAGAWTAYPFFESGTVVVSSINEGLFLLRPARRPVP